MWSRLDDALLDHRKVYAAADVIGGENAIAIAIGFYAVGLMYSNKHLSDGFLPLTVVKRWPHVADPLKVAEAMVRASLWTPVNRDGIDGFQVHDFAHYNPSGSAVRSQRKRDAERKRDERQSQQSTKSRKKNGHA